MAPDAFWSQVDANFAAGRIKLVFVADAIPRELARIVEFLNEQMKADVPAVELSWFTGGGVTALAPRVIGRTERAAASKTLTERALPPIGRDEWIAKASRPRSVPKRRPQPTGSSQSSPRQEAVPR